MPIQDYFILESDDNLALSVLKRRKAAVRSLDGTQTRTGWTRNYQFYSNNFFTKSYKNLDVNDLDRDGIIKGMAFNHYRNILRHMLNLITQQRPAIQVVSKNTDIKSIQASRIGSKIIDHYLDAGKLERYLYSTIEKALVYGQAFLVAEWNPTFGEELIPDENGQIRYKGDFNFKSFGPFDVFYDYDRKDANQCNWFMYREKVNKYDLASSYSSKEQQILDLTFDPLEEESVFPLVNSQLENEYEENVYVYYLYHRKTPAVPNGKTVICAGSENNPVLLYSGDLLYNNLPIFRVCPSENLENAIGFTEANLLRAPQIMINTIISSAFTSLNAFGVQNIWTPPGANFNITQLAGNMNHIASEVKPEALQLINIPEVSVAFMKEAMSSMQLMSGINSTVRGQPETNLKSGIAIALVTALANQFSSALERAYIGMIEDVCNHLFDTLKVNAKLERLIEIAGTNNKSECVSFTSDTITPISRVKCKPINPVTKTAAGRVEIAQNLLQNGLIKKPQEYLTVIETGNLDVMIEAPEKEIEWMKTENENILNGVPVSALSGENHQSHIETHLAITYDSNLRQDQNNPILISALNHIREHQQLMQNGDMIFMARNGQVPPNPLDILQAPQLPQPQGNTKEAKPLENKTQNQRILEGQINKVQEMVGNNTPQ